MKTYFKILLALYSAALVVCMACRVILKLYHMDTFTGFYTGGDLYVTVFNLLLASVPVIMFASNRLKKPDDDYPLDNRSIRLNWLALFCGALIIAFSIAGAPESGLQQGYSPMFYQICGYIRAGLGFLSGIAFLHLGIGGVFGRPKPPAELLVIIPAVWQIILLVMRYNSYTTVISISDHMLLVLFMIFNTLFLIGMARTVCLQMRKDGRNYAIPAGFCASLCGFLLVIPNYAYMAVNSKPMPVALLGLVESACVSMMSIYALFFVIGLIRSIKRV